jgi:hypothetical protein
LDASPAIAISNIVLLWRLSSWAERLGLDHLAVLLRGLVGRVVTEDIVLHWSWRLRVELANIASLSIRVVIVATLVHLWVDVRSWSHHRTVVWHVAVVHIVSSVAVLRTVEVVLVRILLVRRLSVLLWAHHALVHRLVLVVNWLGLVVHLDWVSVRVSLDWSFLFPSADECHNNTC